MKKYGLCLVVMCAAIVACNDGSTQSPPLRKPAISFIHLNDTYRVGDVEDGRRGGFSRIATLVRELKKDGRDVRILHGGDFLYPSLESQLWRGEQMVEAFNYLDSLAPMTVVPGNHEFDPRSPDSLIHALGQSKFDWIADNLRLNTGSPDADSILQSGFTFETGDHRIGIFALSLHPADGGNDRDYAPLERDYIERANDVIEGFESQGADAVIGLTHLHLVDDMEIAKLKQAHPKFMFIVGGHEHEPEYEPGTASSAVIMKGASNARTVWQIDVYFDESGNAEIETTMIAVDESIKIDSDYELIAEKWRNRLLGKMPFLPSKVGVAAVPMDAREVTVRNEESNWGNFIADQMLSAYQGEPAELAFVNSGTLRIDDLVAGDISFEDIGRTFGFSSYLRYMAMTGADFRELLEAGYRGYGPSKGYFPQIAGFRVCVDRSQPDGQRIVQMLVPMDGGWQEISPERDYAVVAPDYIYRGGDGYDFSKARNVSKAGSELQYLVLDAILVAQAQGRAIGAPVDPIARRFAILQPGQAVCFD